ncbi:MAG: hypothetical protein ACPG7F_00905 [Aggregatilineales bacterium]
MSIAGILPYLATFLETEITPDGDSGRGVHVPLIWGDAINVSKDVVFLNQITGYDEIGRNNLYVGFNVSVVMRLYYQQIGQGNAAKPYDIFSYMDSVITALIRKPRFETGSTVLPGIIRPAISSAEFPILLQYPVDNPQGISYVGAEINLSIPIQVTGC